MAMLVKVLGPAGTFGHEVSLLLKEELAREYGNLRLDFVAQNEDVLTAAEYSRCIGIVPIYNSDAKLVQGVVHFWLRERRGFRSNLIGVKKLRVRHQLLVHASITRPARQIRGIASHLHALGQTTKVQAEFDLRTRKLTPSTAHAARLVATDRSYRRYAAVASELAQATYGLKSWRTNVEDSEKNFTIFHVFGPHPTQPTQLDRTDVILLSSLSPARLGARLSAMNTEFSFMRSSRQISKDRDSVTVFYCRFDAHRHTANGRAILRELGLAGDTLVLGSYPLT